MHQNKARHTSLYKLTFAPKGVFSVSEVSSYKLKEVAMASFQESVSNAVKTQAARSGVSFETLAKTIGISRNSFSRRVNNQKSWESTDFDALALGLKLKDVWEFLALAKSEQMIADSAPTQSKSALAEEVKQ